MYDEFHNSDYFRIDLVTENDENYAENIMRRAIDILVYVTGVPYELDYLREDLDVSIQPINLNASKKKLGIIADIDAQYNRINQKKELLENTLRLYSLAMKYIVLFGASEDAYFAMFRVIEKIAKDEFSIECGSINSGRNIVRTTINKITQNVYGVKIPSNKLDDLAGKFSSELMDMVFSDIYSKIAWFCGKKSIFYDETILAKAVKLRNKLAHGDNVNVNDGKELDMVIDLSEKFIYEKFFDNIKCCHLESEMII